MKIILLASGAVRSSLTARVVNLGRELVKYGHDVVLVAPNCDKYTNFSTDSLTDIDGIKIIHPAQFNSRWQTLNFIPYIPSAAWHIWREKADIVHLYKPTPLTLVGLVSKFRTKTRIVLDMDDLGSEVMLRENNARWKVWLVAKSENIAARYANAIVTASSYLRDYFQKTQPNKVVLWIPNGVAVLDPGTAKVTAPIVFIGSLNNLEVIMPLINAIPQIATAVISNGPIVSIIGDGEKRSDLVRLVHQNGVGVYVSFSDGWIKQERLNEVVGVGDIGYCCVPNENSYIAASSQKVFNYLSLGVVPLVNNVGDLAYYVEDGKSGYIVADDLATTLIRAMSDKKERDQKIKAGQSYLKANFLWPTLAKKLEKLYIDQLVGGKVSK